MYSAMSGSPPVIALKTDVLTRPVVGRSGQMLASRPTRRATENRSLSSLCRLTAEALYFPMKARTAPK